MSELHQFFRVLDELRRRVVRILWVVVPLFGFVLFFKLQAFPVPGLPFPLVLPIPSPFYNITAQVFLWFVHDMLPPGVTLLNIGVGDSVVAQMEIGLLLSLVLSTPWIAHEVGAFLVPALRTNERALIRSVALPATALFAVGFLLALFWLTPFTFLLLFRYVGALDLAPVLSVGSFLAFALLYTLAFGVVFELPVFIYTLSRLRLVPADFWRRHWRGAVIGCLVFGMLITPDNSGITMLLIAIPMMGLYVGGMVAAERHERHAGSLRHGGVPGGAA
jgi:sec-independent protein translocase protein TatC